MSLLNRYLKRRKNHLFYNVGKHVFLNEYEANRYIELSKLEEDGVIANLRINVIMKILDEDLIGIPVYVRIPFYYLKDGVRYAEFHIKNRRAAVLRTFFFVKKLLLRKFKIVCKIFSVDGEEVVGINTDDMMFWL